MSFINFAITKNGKPVLDKNNNIDRISYKENSFSLMNQMYNETISNNGKTERCTRKRFQKHYRNS